VSEGNKKGGVEGERRQGEKMTEPIRTTDETGRQIIVHESGTIQDASNGRIIQGPRETPVTRDPRGMLALRNAKSKLIAREAIDEAMEVDPSLWGTDEGYRQMIVHAVKVFKSSKTARGLGELLTKILSAGGYLTREEAERIVTPSGITATPDSIVKLIEALDREAQRRVDERTNANE
jgi:hypothetical protein